MDSFGNLPAYNPIRVGWNSASTAPIVTTTKNIVANPGRLGDVEFPVSDGAALARIGIHTGGGANNACAASHSLPSA